MPSRSMMFPELLGVFIYLYYNSKKLADWQSRNSKKVSGTWFMCPFVKLCDANTTAFRIMKLL